jgi:hypothetical protein
MDLPTTVSTNGGVMIFTGYSFEWHIEYRSADGTGLSPDPADPGKTFRVFTLYVTEDLLAKKTSADEYQSDCRAYGRKQPRRVGG